MSFAPLELVGELPAEQPGFLSANVLPDRGMMLFQARLRLPSGEVVDALQSPPLAQAGFGGPDDFAGNRSFAFGGAILAPFANRIRGQPVAGARQIEADLQSRGVRLPANWSGKAPGAEAYAMHGLMLAAQAEILTRSATEIRGRVLSRELAGEWPGDLAVEVGWSLRGGVLRLNIEVRNEGAQAAPVGIGWHPWFALPSGRRDLA